MQNCSPEPSVAKFAIDQDCRSLNRTLKCFLTCFAEHCGNGLQLPDTRHLWFGIHQAQLDNAVEVGVGYRANGLNCAPVIQSPIRIQQTAFHGASIKLKWNVSAKLQVRARLNERQENSRVFRVRNNRFHFAHRKIAAPARAPRFLVDDPIAGDFLSGIQPPRREFIKARRVITVGRSKAP